jgi:pyruvate formate lyase activating enzyme
MTKASYFTHLINENKIRCELCPHHCVLSEGKSGICLTRRNKNNELMTINYCRPVSMSVDPIEKKPLYHFHPGSKIFSTGPNGCTFKCMFCQNWEISQKVIPAKKISPKDFIKTVTDSDSIGIAYTYSEPYIWFETIMEIGPVLKTYGLKNVMVTNGYMEHKPLMDLLEFVDAMNIDIKSIRPDFYKKLCNAELKPVLDTCIKAKKMCHIEITNLLIPGENDSIEDIMELSDFIAVNLGKDTPLHFSRYFPRYKMTTQPTDESVLLRAWEIARAELDYVYIGNIDIKDKSDTHCPSCGTILIRRNGYNVEIMSKFPQVQHSHKLMTCPECGYKTNIST